MAKASYKSAGVDLDLYEQSMARIPRLVRRTYSPRVLPAEGHFAGLFRLDFACPLFARKYENPVLISCCDGVGTKLKVAQMMGIHNTVGIDLVAMSVNDALCCGAEPLFFLDYLVMGRDVPDLVEQLVEGITAGCVQADCALLGGETAIHPGHFQEQDDYDLAGFCVGVVEQKNLIEGHAISEGDVLLGIASSGIHSNGYSLVRKIVFEIAGHKVDDYVEELGDTVGNVLLTPTRIYAKPVRRVLNHYKVKNVVHGIAHITGGGLRENIERIIPAGLHVDIDEGSWPVPPVFTWMQRLGEVDADEMARVFNMGIGLVLIVAPYYAASVQRMLADEGLASCPIGRITAKA